MTFLYEGKLNDLDTSIARQIEANPSLIIDNNIFVAADILGISASKLTKYCQKIKLHGFKEIKFRLVQEQKREKNVQLLETKIKIEDLINPEYIFVLTEIPKLINNADKIVLICNSSSLEFAKYLCYKLRKVSLNVVAYAIDQQCSFEFLSDNVVVILIDSEDELVYNDKRWYRSGHYYLQITTQSNLNHYNYVPIVISNSKSQLPFDVKVMLLFNWLVETTENRESRKTV